VAGKACCEKWYFLSFAMVSDKEKSFYKIDTLSTISLVMAGSRAMASVPLG